MKRIYFALRPTRRTRPQSLHALHEVQIFELAGVIRDASFHTYIRTTTLLTPQIVTTYGVTQVQHYLYRLGRRLTKKHIMEPRMALTKFLQFIADQMVPASHQVDRDPPVEVMLVGEGATRYNYLVRILCYNLIRFQVQTPASLKLKYFYDSIPLVQQLKIARTDNLSTMAVVVTPRAAVCEKVKSKVTALDEARSLKKFLVALALRNHQCLSELMARAPTYCFESMYMSCLSETIFESSKTKARVMRRLLGPNHPRKAGKQVGAVASVEESKTMPKDQGSPVKSESSSSEMSSSESSRSEDSSSEDTSSDDSRGTRAPATTHSTSNRQDSRCKDVSGKRKLLEDPSDSESVDSSSKASKKCRKWLKHQLDYHLKVSLPKSPKERRQ